jgi:hypothetical protein
MRIAHQWDYDALTTNAPWRPGDASVRFPRIPAAPGRESRSTITSRVFSRTLPEPWPAGYDILVALRLRKIQFRLAMKQCAVVVTIFRIAAARETADETHCRDCRRVRIGKRPGRACLRGVASKFSKRARWRTTSLQKLICSRGPGCPLLQCHRTTG